MAAPARAETTWFPRTWLPDRSPGGAGGAHLHLLDERRIRDRLLSKESGTWVPLFFRGCGSDGKACGGTGSQARSPRRQRGDGAAGDRSRRTGAQAHRASRPGPRGRRFARGLRTGVPSGERAARRLRSLPGCVHLPRRPEGDGVGRLPGRGGCSAATGRRERRGGRWCARLAIRGRGPCGPSEAASLGPFQLPAGGGHRLLARRRGLDEFRV